jgi:hypothetical protein
MSLQNKAPSNFAAGTVNADDDRGLGVLFGKLATSGMPLYRRSIHVEAIESEAAFSI